MNISRKSGAYGEQLAVDYLIEKDYSILERNWRSGRCEIDIIATDGTVLVFVEVKTRSGSMDFGTPESYVDNKKQKMLLQGADGYIKDNLYIGEARFDIVAVQLHDRASRKGDSCITIEHFIDAFYGIG